MKNISITIAFMFFMQFLAAQEIKIIPGVGAGEMKIGMSRKEVEKLLGKQYQSETFAQHMRGFLKYDTSADLTQIPQFVLGFDEAWTYDEYPTNYPVYTIYLLNGKVNFINFSTYGCPDSVYQKFSVEGSRFLDPESATIEKFGQDYVNIVYEDYVDLLYPEKGLELVFGDEEHDLRCVSIMAPEPDYLKLKERRYKALKKQQEAIKKDLSEPEDENR